MEIKYRVSKKNKKKIKFKRILDKNSPKLNYYNINESSLNNIACHLGQRKLLYTEIEFLTIISKENNLSNYLIVYIGSAKGFHIPVLHKLFPNTKFLLIDPAPFYSNLFNHPDIYIIKNMYFDDDKIDEVLKIADGKKIIFISDIRVDTKEENVLKDNHNQQRWLMKMNAEYYMLKLRLPYILKDNNIYNKEMNKEEIKDVIKIIKKKQTNEDFETLSGNIYIQLYPPGRSSETRLIGKKKNKYEITTINIIDYDEQINYHNQVVRNSPCYFKESEQLKNHLLGYDDGYDSCGEYYLIYYYIKNYLKKSPTLKNIISIIYDINIQMYDIYHKYVLNCIFDIFQKKNHPLMYQQTITNYIYEIKNLPEILNYQISIIKKSNIINEYQLKKMIKIIWSTNNKYLTFNTQFSWLTNNILKLFNKK
jgi:hypothetical protein